MHIELQRYEHLNDRVLGVVSINRIPLYNSLEPLNCIPAGEYEVRLTWSPRYKRWLPEVMNVPGRTGIRIHAGNYPQDTKGCILIGERLSDYIIKSREAMNDLLKRFKYNEKERHTIRITEIDYMG